MTTFLEDRCPSCGEPLDRGADWCRLCGEGREQPSAKDAPEEDFSPPDFLDRLGDWSEIKHEIIESYARQYTKILSANTSIRRRIYIDGFAGAGVAVDRESGDLLAGSPYRMLFDVDPPFSEYHFIEIEPAKAEHLRRVLGRDPRVHIHLGDANVILPRDVLPRCRWEDFARALCLLDPYGLTVDWSLLKTIGEMESVEIFFNFMIVGANRNVLWKDPSRVSKARRELLTRGWGDESWATVAYREVNTLFGVEREKIKGNDVLIGAYRKRLKDVAGFAYVPEPIPMKNSMNAIVYYLFFASPNAVGGKIVAASLTSTAGCRLERPASPVEHRIGPSAL